MGQRLNIEIVDGETSLANCYYHWSADTNSALELTKQIIDSYYNSKLTVGLEMAVELLEATGAGINKTERAEIQKQPEKFGSFKFKDCTSRNDGLISITEKGKETTREQEEGRVTIDLSTETFDFDVLLYYTMENYTYYCDANFDEATFKKLPECPFNLFYVPFKEVNNFIDFVEENESAREFETILCWI